MVSGVGSSTVAPTYGLAITNSANTAPAAATGNLNVAPPLYSVFGAAFGTELLGLRVPQNPEDAAMLLAQLALAVDVSASEASNDKILGALAALRSNLGSAIAAILDADGQIVAKTTSRVDAQIALATSEQLKADLTTQQTEFNGRASALMDRISVATQDKTGLEDDRTRLAAQQTALLGDVDEATRGIGRLDDDIAAAEAANDPERAANLKSQRDAAVDARTGIQDALGAVESALSQVGSDIERLATEITAARSELAPVNTSLADIETALSAVASEITAGQAAIERLTGEIAALAVLRAERGLALVFSFSKIAVFLHDAGGEQPRTQQRAGAFDLFVDDINRNLQRFQQGSVAMAEVEARMTSETRDLDTERRIVQAAGGLLAGLSDLLQTLQRLREEPVETVSDPDTDPLRYRLAV